MAEFDFLNVEGQNYYACDREARAAISAYQQGKVLVVADHTAVSSPDPQMVYREQGTSSYSDWMYQNSTWKKLCTVDGNFVDAITYVEEDDPTSLLS